jgi:ketosteroid isomerase-like protein
MPDERLRDALSADIGENSGVERGSTIGDGAETVVRRAYEAYVGGDLDGMLELVDPDLEWTFLDPAFIDPEPRVCHGRHELERALRRQASLGLHSALDEVLADGERVLVAIRTPGVEAFRADGRAGPGYDVITVRDGRIAAMRACRDRDEALEFLRD